MCATWTLSARFWKTAAKLKRHVQELARLAARGLSTLCTPIQGDNERVNMKQEESVWSGTPSQVINFGPYVLCLLGCWLIVPIFIALWKYLVVRTTRYEVTTQRLRLRTGVFNKETQDLELYRVKDFKVDQPFFLRLFSVANIVLETSDRSHPNVTLRAVPDAESLLDQIRHNVEALRSSRGVRELDLP